METRAHHVVIGLFTIVIFSAILLFSLWLSNTGSRDQPRYYDVVFNEPVSGLSQGSPVQYNGIQIGEVASLKLDKTDLSKVWARIRITSSTPIKQDTRAGLALTGITGTSYILLSHGTSASPELNSTEDHIAIITATPSSLSKLLNNSQDLMTNINDVLTRLERILSDENITHLNNMLINIERITSTLASHDAEISNALNNISQASNDIHSITSIVNQRAGKLFDSADKMLNSMQQNSTQINVLLKNNRSAINNGLQSFNEIGPALHDFRTTLHRLNNITRNLEEDPASYLLEREKRQEYTPK